MALTLSSTLEPYARIDPSNFTDLQGKHVLITGGGSGIGARIAESFAQAGVASILLTGRTQSTLEATANKLHETYPGVDFATSKLDIASKDSVNAFFDTLGGIPDILVNNAGYLPPLGNFVDEDIDDWLYTIQVNMHGAIRLTYRFLRAVRADKGGSRKGPATVIMNNSVVAVGLNLPAFSAYSASKAGLLRATELIALNVPADEVRVLSLHPGLVQTNMGEQSNLSETGVPYTDAKLAGDFAAWLATDEAAFLHGRLAHCNWPVDELIAAKATIVEKDLLKTALSM